MAFPFNVSIKTYIRGMTVNILKYFQPSFQLNKTFNSIRCCYLQLQNSTDHWGYLTQHTSKGKFVIKSKGLSLWKKTCHEKTLAIQQHTLVFEINNRRSKQVPDSLTHFNPMSHFYTPWKRQKWGIEMWDWNKMG